MNLNLKDKHVLITGGSKGIGYSCVEAFLNEGARVSIVSRNIENLNQAVKKLNERYSCSDKVNSISADLTSESQAMSAVLNAEKHFGFIEILVNCAGHAKRTLPENLEIQDFQDAMQAKYFSYLNVINPVIKKMGLNGTGSIVNIVGRGGKIALIEHLPGGAANSALMLVSAGLAVAYADKGVRVNVINPGITTTDRFKERAMVDAKRENITLQECIKSLASQIPIKRFAEPSEIAQAVLFLASPMSSYVTGNVMAMDGGILPII